MYKLSGFIPHDIKINKWEDLKPYSDKILATQPETIAELEKLIVQYSEIASVFDEQYAWSYINMSCHTDNKDYVERYETFSAEIMPEVSKAANAIDKKITEHPLFDQLDTARYTQLKRSLKRDLELFRDKNVPIEAELSKLSTKVDQITGGLTALIDGEELPLPQASVKLQSTAREVRKNAWLEINKSRIEVKQKLDDIFSDMVKRRHQLALNTGYQNFRDYKHDKLHRFDYTPKDALLFHDSIEKHVLPIASVIAEKHREKLGLEENDYYPWDTAGQPCGQEPLKPFTKGTELLKGAIGIFSKLNPQFGENLKSMDNSGLFDLDSRKAKAPGGYNYPLSVTGMPFIFMNAAGVQRDLTTMMHEGGHAMHTFYTNDEPLIQYRETPSEMAEVASMSMELMTSSYWDHFYNDQDLIRARREHLEDIIMFFPWCAIVDAFQHWIYLNPEHNSDERDSAFLEISQRFKFRNLNWEGYDNYRRNFWQKQPHIFDVPFYYIEYGIAQLGALQVYQNFLNNPEKALNDYIAGLKLGNTKPLPEVWQAMNISFDFSAEQIGKLMDFVQEELEKLE